MTGRNRIFIILSFLLPLGCTQSMHDEAPFVLTGRWVKPHSSDTLQSIAALYGSDAASLSELNDLPDDRALKERDVIFVPMASGAPPGESPLPTDAAQPDEGAPSESAEADTPEGTTEHGVRKAAAKTDISSKTVVKTKNLKTKNCTVTQNPCLSWPVVGKIGTLYSGRESKPHDGIDILAEKGTLIHAAQEGDVIYSGAKIKGYGNLVILRHPGGMITVYAHNDKNLVTEGAHVNKDAVIAEVGRSGNASFSHLHFEVRVSEIPRNPMEYLPDSP
jgi:murein DD-endopeptidase MepM/ murein hydrolase activator NlpD